MKRAGPHIFDYISYRRFLVDYFDDMKERNPSYSYRVFSRRAQVSSPSHLKRIISGERNLRNETAERYARACGLEGEEASYFLDIVAFDQAKSPAEKEEIYERMIHYRGYREAHRLETEQFEYLSHWYIPVIREMAYRPDFQFDAHWVAAELKPSIGVVAARRALRLLSDLGFLVQEDGKVLHQDLVLRTDAQVSWLGMRKYSKQMIQLAHEAIEETGADTRDISGLTMCIRAKDMPILKEKIRQFRADIAKLAQLGEDAERVVHVAIQAFPVSNDKT